MCTAIATTLTRPSRPSAPAAAPTSKFVEAFAHRVPVVATSIAAEGLDVAPERHLLVADSPLRFAQSCVRLIEKPELRNWLRENASRLYHEAYLPKAMRKVLLKSISNY